MQTAFLQLLLLCLTYAISDLVTKISFYRLYVFSECCVAKRYYILIALSIKTYILTLLDMHFMDI